MNKIIAPLKARMSGPAVADLQDGLQKLLDEGVIPVEPGAARELAAALRREREGQTFAGATRKLVGLFQEGTHLPATGDVDETTAKALNHALGFAEDLPQPVPPPPSPPEPQPPEPSTPEPSPPPEFRYLVRGQVFYRKGLPIAGLEVHAFHRELRSNVELGTATTDENGNFEIYYNPSQDPQLVELLKGRAPDVFVRVFEAPPAGQPAGKLLVESATRFAAQRIVKYRLYVDGGLAKTWSEFEQLEQEIKPHLGDVPVAQLVENDEFRDVSVLSGKLSQDAGRVAAFVAAHKLAGEVEGDPAVFYALARKGLPTNLSELLALPPETRSRTLVTAIDDGIAPGRLVGEIEKVRKQFGEQGARFASVDKEVAGSATLGAVLKSTIADQEKVNSIVGRLMEHHGPVKGLWSQLSEDETLKDSVPEAQLSLQLAALTGRHMPMVRALLQRRSQGEFSTIRDLAKLSEADWLNIVKSPDIADADRAPASIPGKADDQAKTYAATMARIIAESMPTQVIAHRMQAAEGQPDDVKRFWKNVTDGTAGFELGRGSIAPYLEKIPDLLEGVEDKDALFGHLNETQRLFNLTTNFDEQQVLRQQGFTSSLSIARLGQAAFIEKMSGTDLTPQSSLLIYEKATRVAAATLDLMTELTPSFNSALPRVLSAPAVKQVPDLEALFGTLSLCGCDECRSVHGPAAYFADLLAWLADRSSTTAGKSALDVLYARRADLGEIELTCENTNRILPATDLINEVLDRRIAPFAPFDLPPAVEGDLNVRTLSQAIADAFAAKAIMLSPNAQIVVGSATRWSITDGSMLYSILKLGAAIRVTGAWPQSGGDEASLAAVPEHVSLDAQKSLRDAVYPWALPLDLPTEETRLFLTHLKHPRHALMSDLFIGGAEAALGDAAVAAEYIGLSDADRRCVTGAMPAPPDAWDYWGLQQNGNTVRTFDPVAGNFADAALGWVEALGWVSQILQRSGLVYEELVRVLGCDFVNPGRKVRIQSCDKNDAATCDLAKLVVTNFSADVADRLSRFVRLWRKVGGDPEELDHVVVALAGGKINDDALIRLSHVRRLREAFDRTTDELLTLWASIGTNGDDSLYSRLFLNPDVLAPVDPAFALDAAGEVALLAADPAKAKISLHIPTIQAALGLSAADVTALKAAGIGKDDALSLANLSALNRHALLARCLELGIPDLLLLLSMSGLDPFDPAASADTLRLVELAAKLQESTLAVSDLAYLLFDAGAETAPLALAWAGPDSMVSEVRRQLKPIFDATQPRADPVGDVLRRELAVLKWPASNINSVIADLTDRTVYATSLDPAPADFAIPTIFTDRLSYDPAAKTLNLVGSLTGAERNTLLAAFPDGNYQTAINDLFSQPRDGLAHRMRAFDWPRISVPLAAMPAGLSLPSALRARLSYDPATKALSFDGTMTADDKAALDALSAGATWRNATADLLAAAEAFAPSTENSFVSAAAADKLFEMKQPADRFAALLGQLLDRRRTSDGSQLVIRVLAEAVELKPSLVERLLTRDLDHPVMAGKKAIDAFLEPAFAGGDLDVTATAALFPAVFDISIRVAKIAALVVTMRLSDRVINWLGTFSASVAVRGAPWGAGAVKAGWLALAELPPSDEAIAPTRFAAWLRLFDLASAGKLLPGGEATVEAIFTAARDPAATADSVLTCLAGLTAWDKTELVALSGAIGLALPDDLKDESGLTRLCTAMRRITRLRTDTGQAQQWAASAPTADAAVAARRAVQAAYPADQWPDAIRPLEEVLREMRRSALVAYLVVRADPTRGEVWTTTNGMYSHLLIDVETHPVVLTSRLKQAIGSVQLFVQRCMMNLEPEVIADAVKDPGWSQWVWMKQFRVWEANRKIFLYPENWVEPELRDDKSSIFAEFESNLIKSDVTQESAEDAFMTYLGRLDEVARLEVAGVFHQPGEGGPDEYHVFAKTHSDPPTYYYRKWVGQARWTPWERVELDIPAGQILPLVWNRRLYLFWPLFTRKVDQPPTGDKPVAATPYFEIQLAWSEYRRGGWGPKKITPADATLRSMIAPQDGVSDGGRDRHVFRATVNGTELRIWYEASDAAATQVDKYGVIVKPSGAPSTDGWLFSGCNGRISVFKPSNVGVFPPPNTYARGMTFEELGRKIAPDPANAALSKESTDPNLSDGTVQLPKGVVGTDAAVVLRQTPGAGPFRLLAPHQEQYLTGRLPFFFQDDLQTLFVIPESITQYFPVWTKPDVIHPRFIDLIDTVFYRPDPQPDPIGPIERIWDPVPVLRASAKAEASVLEAPAPSMAQATPTPIVPVAATAGLQRAMTARKAQITSMFDTKQRAIVAIGDRDISTIDDYLRPDRLFEPVTVSWNAVAVRRYLFRTHYHPYVCAMVRALNLQGTDKLLERATQLQNSAPFEGRYKPSAYVDMGDATKKDKYPLEDVDFEFDGAYSGYNWELFFHAPLMIACKLMQNQRFEEAQKWFHTIFDPTDVSSNPIPQRYWRTRPFFERQDYLASRIDKLIEALAKGQTDEDASRQLSEWIANPFRPFAVARVRTVAFQKTVVMKYIDNLIAWGDLLFRRDTIEAINEATQLYILAAEILGPRPVVIPPRATPEPHSFNSLAPKFAALTNKMTDIETIVSPQRVDAVVNSADSPPLPVPQLLYFCVPPNDKLLGYWDTVADRLFKIRNSLNLAGIRRTMPLFEPPIDPMLLVKASAAGVDLSTAIADLYAPPPLYRFSVMAAKAAELCQEVKALGAALLSALERRDSEDLGRVQAVHELALLTRVADIKAQHVDEAQAQIDALLAARALANERYQHFMTLLGNAPKIPAEGVAAADATNVAGGSTQDKDGVRMTAQESFGFSMDDDALDGRTSAAEADQMGNVLSIIPTLSGIAAPWGGGISLSFGGSNLGAAAQAIANMYRGMADISSSAGARGFRLSDLVMRAHSWKLESNLAAREMARVDKDLAAARIRLVLAAKERDSQLAQVDEQKEVEELLRTKFTRKELYDWMVGQISATYFQAYELAYDTARRAEQAYRRELAQPDTNFIRFGYWDSLRKGLLAGDALLHDLRRMEVSYLEQNVREYEIMKHVSLESLYPEGLLALQEKGACFVELPEALFDLDHPGHYMRRIKSVSITIPCVAGPYTSIPCKLTLLANRTRVDPGTTPQYGVTGADDRRFEFNAGGFNSIVTSGGRDDSGLFEPNLRDERYLPFEGAGAISAWRVELPEEFRPFDYRTISDVILHIRYTAREGGDILRSAAAKSLSAALKAMAVAPGRTGLVRGLSARHDYPDAWNAFTQMPEALPGNPTLTLDLMPDRFPSFADGRTVKVTRVLVALIPASGIDYDGDDPMTVTVTTPGGASQAATINIVPDRAGDLPMAEVLLGVPATIVAPKPGEVPKPWTIEVTHIPANLMAKVNGAPVNRVDADKVSDLAILGAYTI